MFLSSALAICGQRFPCQLVSSDYEYAVRFSGWDINHTQIPASGGLAQGDPGTLAPRPILSRRFQNVDDLILVHLVVMYVR
jgi:hypothetical protein